MLEGLRPRNPQGRIRRPPGLRGLVWAGNIAAREWLYQVINTAQIRLQLALFVVMCALAWWRDLDFVGWLIFPIPFVLAMQAELANSAIEKTIGLASPKGPDGEELYDPQVGEAKNIAAASVTPAAVWAVIVCLALLIHPHL